MKETGVMALRKSVTQNAWDKDHTSRIAIKLNNNTDADILAWLAQQPNKQGYIKDLIRKDMEIHQAE